MIDREFGPGLLARLAAGRGDQRRLRRLASRIVAANLVTLDSLEPQHPGCSWRSPRRSCC